MVETKISRGREGYEARSEVDLASFGLPGQFLQIGTYKVSGGSLVTTVGVVKIDRGMVSFMMYGDYRVTAKRAKVRVTEKSVSAQHAEILAVLPNYITEAVNFYKKAA